MLESLENSQINRMSQGLLDKLVDGPFNKLSSLTSKDILDKFGSGFPSVSDVLNDFNNKIPQIKPHDYSINNDFISKIMDSKKDKIEVVIAEELIDKISIYTDKINNKLIIYISKKNES
ncbi:hypothetical protein ACQUW5_15115 [Legionella sp. CNM-1927-20]|uniref:hypothetical protein n=1 Tax=Legionella sp. CNM-1927-20 TaxID=3422221 RepID=UPI00403A8931